MSLADDITTLIPWRGDHQDWLDEAIASLPDGMRVLLVKNSGLGDMCSGLNAALEEIDTPFVWLMAADDRCGEDMLNQLRLAIGTADFAYPSMRLFGERDDEFYADLPSYWRVQDSNVCGVFLARTEVLRRCGWQPAPCEDWNLVYRMMRSGARGVAVPHAKYEYRIHSDSHGHRSVREAQKLDLTKEDYRYLCVGEDRTPLVATFYCDQNRATAYVRGEIPARYLPGAARSVFDQQGEHYSPAAIFQYPSEVTRPFIDRARERGEAFIVDVDDNYASPQLVSTMRRQARWAAGLADLADEWALMRPAHRKLVQEADAVICSTLYLADEYSRLNPNVHCILNTVDPADWPTLHPNRFDDTIRVGWMAGTQHGLDAPLVEPALRWASQQPGVEVVIVGVHPGWDFPHVWLPSTPSTQTYRDLVSVLDIGLAPVMPGVMNRSKSDLKFLEYTMGSVATIASRQPAYENTIIDGETGRLCRNKTEFKRAVQELVRDETERVRLTQNAMTYVHEHRVAPLMRDAYLVAVASTGAISFKPLAETKPNRAERRAAAKKGAVA